MEVVKHSEQRGAAKVIQTKRWQISFFLFKIFWWQSVHDLCQVKLRIEQLMSNEGKTSALKAFLVDFTGCL